VKETMKIKKASKELAPHVAEIFAVYFGLSNRILSALLEIFATLYIVVFIVQISIFEANNNIARSENIFFRPISIVIINAMLVFLVYICFRQTDITKGHHRDLYYSLVVIIITLGLYWYVSLFAERYYDKIPERFGGGEPKQVQILVGKDDVEGFRQLGIPLPTSNQPNVPSSASSVTATPIDVQLSADITLLYEGENTYVFKAQNNQIIQIKKDIVQGIKYASNLQQTTPTTVNTTPIPTAINTVPTPTARQTLTPVPTQAGTTVLP
jgi:hypothetical protein